MNKERYSRLWLKAATIIANNHNKELECELKDKNCSGRLVIDRVDDGIRPEGFYKSIIYGTINTENLRILCFKHNWNKEKHSWLWLNAAEIVANNRKKKLECELKDKTCDGKAIAGKLVIDHINNDGIERNERGTYQLQQKFYMSIIYGKRSTEDLRILCSYHNNTEAVKHRGPELRYGTISLKDYIDAHPNCCSSVKRNW